MGSRKLFSVSAALLGFDVDKMVPGNMDPGLWEKLGLTKEDWKNLDDEERETLVEELVEGEKWHLACESLELDHTVIYNDESGIIVVYKIKRGKESNVSPLLGMTKVEKAFIKKVGEEFKRIGANRLQVQEYKLRALEKFREERDRNIEDRVDAIIEKALKPT